MEAPGGNVPCARHVGEKGVVLEEVSHPPSLGRQIHPAGAVEEHLAVQLDPSPVGPLDAGNTLQSHALPAPGGAQKRQCGPGRGLELCVQEKASGPLLNPHLQRHRPASFRSSRFTAASTDAESARFTSTQRRASASCPVRQSW